MAVSMSAEQLKELARIGPLLSRVAAGEPVDLSKADRTALGQLGDELSELATTLSTCATFMSDLMKQMKQFQRREAAAPVSVEVAVAPVPVIKLTLSMCRSGTIAGSKLAYDGPADLPRVKATSTDLLQILVNLVRNALQALEEHRIKQGAVDVLASIEGEAVRFTVRDNGPGIPADVLAQLGTPFYTTRENGTGLGVSQCKRLVGRLGGELQIESDIGVGTSVSFTLPLTV
jgi:signal transduction histidine kinase